MLAPMDWPRLDTSSWNLSLGVVATSMLAACGPFVILEDGETDSDSVTDTDPRPTEPSETDTTPSVECQNASDCQPGEECIGNVCQPYEYYCDDGGCCYGGTGGCCYDECCYGECYYNECYADEDCGPMGLCLPEYGYACVWAYELPECGVAPAVVPLELPLVGEGELVSLSFVEVNGDGAADIVVGRNGTAELHPGGGAAMPSLLPVPVGASVSDAAAGDFDGDGDRDIAIGTLEGGLFVLFNDGVGGFVLGPELPLGEPSYDLVALQWNGDGALDLVLRRPMLNALLLLNDGTGWLGASVSLPIDTSSIAAIDFGDPQYGAFVLQNGVSGEVYQGDFGGDTNPDAYLPGTARGPRQLVAGRIDASLPEEAIGYTQMSGWLLLELWANGVEGPQRYSITGEDSLAAMGDFSGDGAADLITAGGSVISYVRGYGEGYPGLECRSTYFNGGSALTMAAGDHDGNGRADVVIDSGSGPYVLLTQ